MTPMTDGSKAPVGQRVHHPAHRLYGLTALLLGLTVLFGFIAVFVPWVMKDLGVGQRAWAYPFKTCVEDTFSKLNAEACQDNDFIVPTGTPLTGGSATCKGFILSTIAFVFISVILGVVILVVLLLVIDRLWVRPMLLASIAQVGLIVVNIAAFLSWIMFICYAENTCVAGSIFPVKGYSYGFIIYVFASVFSLGAVVTGFMGMSKLRAFQPAEKEEIPLYPIYPQVQEPSYPMPYYAYPHNTPQDESFNAPVPVTSFNYGYGY